MIHNRRSTIFAGLTLILSMLACNIGSSAPSSGDQTSNPPSSDSAPAASGGCSNPLYPVAVGVSWTYSLTGPISDSFTRTITGITDSGFTDQDVFASGVSRAGNWNCNNGALIALDPNSGDGNATAQSQHATGNFNTTAMDGVTLPATVNPGDTWTQNFTMDGTVSVNGQDIPVKNIVAYSCTAAATESVSVPAGTFNAVHMDCTTNMSITMTLNGVDSSTPVNTSSTMWYAPRVGLVKSSNLINGAEANVMELTAYTIP